MSITHVFTVEEDDFTTGKNVIHITTWRVHHNGDYSGDVRIVPPDGYDYYQDDTWIQLPFDLLKQMVAEYIRSNLTEELEQAHPDKLLTGRLG